MIENFDELDKKREKARKRQMLYINNRKLSWATHCVNNIRKSKTKTNSKKTYDHDKIDAVYLKTLLKKQKNKCSLSGLPINFDNPLFMPSVDRIDSEKGYTKDNIHITTRFANLAKNKYTIEQFNEVNKAYKKLFSNN